jgi:hypothetical protein
MPSLLLPLRHLPREALATLTGTISPHM